MSFPYHKIQRSFLASKYASIAFYAFGQMVRNAESTKAFTILVSRSAAGRAKRTAHGEDIFAYIK